MKQPDGPLSSLFGNPQARAAARVLDQSIIVGNMEQTVAVLAESARLDYKTVQKVSEETGEAGTRQEKPEDRQRADLQVQRREPSPRPSQLRSKPATSIF